MHERPGYQPYPVAERLEALRVLPWASDGAGARIRSTTPWIWEDVLDDGMVAVLKLYPHRGPVSWEREKRFRFRVEREFRGLERLVAGSVPCTEPLFWTVGRHARLGRFEVLATRKIPDAVPLSAWVGTDEGWPSLEGLMPLVRRMHEAGVFHGALWLKNILTTPAADGGHDFHLLDMPKAMLFPSSIVGSRMAAMDLLDLLWWVRKESGVDTCRPLASAYGLEDEDQEALLSRLERHRPTRFTRNRQRFEFSVRELLGRRRGAGGGA